jgi:hypothetical protein
MLRPGRAPPSGKWAHWPRTAACVRGSRARPVPLPPSPGTGRTRQAVGERPPSARCGSAYHPRRAGRSSWRYRPTDGRRASNWAMRPSPVHDFTPGSRLRNAASPASDTSTHFGSGPPIARHWSWGLAACATFLMDAAKAQNSTELAATPAGFSSANAWLTELACTMCAANMVPP